MERFTGNLAIDNFILGKKAYQYKHVSISDSACPACDIENHVIYSPVLPPVIDPVMDSVIRGKNEHEAGHGRLTPGNKASNWSEAKGNLVNALEDLRIEKGVGALSPAFVEDLKTMNRVTIEDVNRKFTADGGAKIGAVNEAIFVMLIRENGFAVNWPVSEMAEKMVEVAKDDFATWKNADCYSESGFSVIEKIADVILEKWEKLIKNENQNDPSKDNKEGQNGDHSEDGERKGDNTEEGQNKDNSESNGDNCSDDAQEDGNTDGDTEDGEDDVQEDGNGKNNGEDGEKSDESNDENGGDSDDSEDGENSNGNAESDINDNGDEKSGNSADGDGESMDSEENNGDNADDSKSDDSDNGGNTENNGKAGKAEKTLTLDDFCTDDTIDDVLKERIEKTVKENKKVFGDYLPYTDEDVVVTPDEKDERIREIFNNEKSKVAGIISLFSSYLEQSLRSMSKCRKICGRDKGMLDVTALPQFAKNLTKNVFYSTKKGISLDTTVSILIDESGSMSEDGKYATCLHVAIALSEVLDRLGIDFEVLGHRCSYSTKCNRSGYTRMTKIIVKEFKAFSEKYQTVKSRLAAVTASGCNVDGEALLYTFKRCISHRSNRHIIIVLSDGEPSGTITTKVGYKHLTDTIDFCRRNGVEVYGFGILTENPKRFYGDKNFVHLRSNNDFRTNFFREVANIITKRGR